MKSYVIRYYADWRKVTIRSMSVQSVSEETLIADLGNIYPFTRNRDLVIAEVNSRW